jgi:HTH-type transcriptional regulator / antitoxin HipB
VRVRRVADVGLAVRDARLAAGLTQGDVAAKAGVMRYVVTNLESGKGNPTLSTLLAVLEVVGLRVDVGTRPVESSQTTRRLPSLLDLDAVLERTAGRG